MKKRTTKILSIILTVFMLFGLVQMTALADTTPALSLDTPLKVTPVDDTIQVTFTPAEDGAYAFSSEKVSSSDPYLRYFYDSQGLPVEPLLGDNDDYYDLEFWVVFELVAGETYTLHLRDYNSNSDGYNITVSKYYGFSHQPTPEEPYVEVFDESGVEGYQWYEMNRESVAVTDQNAEPYVGSAEGSSANDRASYNGVTGGWTGVKFDMGGGEYGHSFFEIELNAGDTVTVVASHEPTQYFLVDSYNGYFTSGVLNGNTVTFAVTEDGTYGLGIAAMSDSLTVTATVNKFTLGDKIEGQTTNVLTEYERDVYYSCTVSYDNGITLSSIPSTVAQHITKQPTAEDPSVEMAYPADVESYRWYEYGVGEASVTDEIAHSVQGPDNSSRYNNETDEWDGAIFDLGGGEYGYNFFTIELKAGDVMTVESSDAVLIYFLAELISGTEAAAEIEGNTITFTVDTDGDYVLGLSTESDSTTVKARMPGLVPVEEVDGQTSATLTNAENGTNYACVITDKDGSTCTSLVFAANEITEAVTAAPTDKEGLEDLIAKIDDLLEGDELTEDERAALLAAKEDAADALAVITAMETNAKNASDKINALPETVTKADADAVKAAEDAYNALTADEKALVSAETLAKLNAAKAALEALEDADNGPTAEPTPESKPIPGTGDSANLTLWTALILISAACALIFGKRKATAE